MGALEWVGAIGDLVAAPFNMIGNIYAANKNYKAQKQANETNIQIAREQNEYNKEMYEDQKEFTWEMWNATNEYNSAKNQRARLIEAGYNPNVLASAGNAGIATGSSAPSAQPAAGANVQAPQLPMNMFQLPQLGSMFLNFKNLSEENKSKQLDNKRKSIENSYLAFEKYWALEKLKGEAKSAYARQVIDNVQASYAGDMAALDFEGKQLTNQNMREQINGNIIRNAMSAIELRYLPLQKRIGIGQMLAELYRSVQSGELTRNQAKKEYYSYLRESKAYQFDKDTYDARVNAAKNNQGPSNVYQGLGSLFERIMDDDDGLKPPKFRRGKNYRPWIGRPDSKDSTVYVPGILW